MKKLILASCMLSLAACSSDDDDAAVVENDANQMDNGVMMVDAMDSDDMMMVDGMMMVDAMMVPANPDAVFVLADEVAFGETGFDGVELAQAFSNDETGSHETFVRVAAGGAIPPHMHSQGTFSVVVNGPMEIPVPIDEMNPMVMGNASGGYAPAATEHLMGCLNAEDACVFLIHQDGMFDVTPTGNMRVDMGTSPRNMEAFEVPFNADMGWVDVGVPGVDFRAVFGNFGEADGTQHGTLVRVQPGMGIPPHFHSLEARGFVLRGDVEIPVPFNQTNPTSMLPGGYFSVPAMAVHEMNCVSTEECIFYLRQDGDFDFTPVPQ